MITSLALAFVVAYGARESVPLKVVGDHLEAAGKRIHLRGVNVCGMEWNGHGENVDRTATVAFDRWNANIVRLPLCEDRWFGKTDDSPQGGEPYRAMVDKVVEAAKQRGKYVLLDLHWSDLNEWGKNIGQHSLPDENSLTFWKDCAARFKNNPAVLFDLYNEPIDAPWAVWRNGGEVKEITQGKQVAYRAVGMQTLLDAIRDVGAKNVIVAGGLGYASRMDFPDDMKLTDPKGNGVVYVSHFYPGWENIPSWEPRIHTFRARKLPLIVSEFGAEPGTGPAQEAAHRVTGVLQVLKRYDLDWIAWCMHPQASPCLISDWNYTPSTYFGVFVKAALGGTDVAIEPRPDHAADMPVVARGLNREWQHWGNAKVNFFGPVVEHGGRSAVSVAMDDGQRIQLGRVPFDANAYKAVSLWLNGGATGGQRLVLQASIMDSTQKEIFELPPLKTEEWIHVEVPFAALGIAGKEDVKSFTLRPARGAAAEFWLADWVLRGKP